MTTQTAEAPVKNEPPPPSDRAPAGEGRVLNVFSHGILILWAVMIVVPLA